MNFATAFDALIHDFSVRKCDDCERALLEMGALPIPWAWVGCFGIRPNGEVVYVDDDGKVNTRELADNPSFAIATLVYAARRNPALSSLLPFKPVSALACAVCSGTGSAPPTANALCGECMGLGWMSGAPNAA